MKKSIVLTLLIVATIAFYIGLYFLLTKNASPDQYITVTQSYYAAVLFGIIAIPVGMALEWVLTKKKLDKYKNLIISVIAIGYGFLFGWITLLPFGIGCTIMEMKK